MLFDFVKKDVQSIDNFANFENLGFQIVFWLPCGD